TRTADTTIFRRAVLAFDKREIPGRQAVPASVPSAVELRNLRSFEVRLRRWRAAISCLAAIFVQAASFKPAAEGFDVSLEGGEAHVDFLLDAPDIGARGSESLGNANCGCPQCARVLALRRSARAPECPDR